MANRPGNSARRGLDRLRLALRCPRPFIYITVSSPGEMSSTGCTKLRWHRGKCGSRYLIGPAGYKPKRWRWPYG